MKRTFTAIVMSLLLAGLGMQFSWLGAWTYQLNGSLNVDDSAQAVAVDGAGDVFVAGALNANVGTPSAWSWVVVKLSGATGQEIWRRELPGNYQDAASALALDSTGGVIVGGSFHNYFAIKKLSQVDGSTLWESEMPGTYHATDTVNAVKVDAAGDVLAAGFISSLGTYADFTAVKLSGSDGTVLWRHSVDGPSHLPEGAASLELRPTGEVVVTGALTHLYPGAGPLPDLLTVALSPLDGHEVWRYQFGLAAGHSVGIDAAGDVLVAGAGFPNITGFPAWKLDGSTGAEQWHTRIANDNGGGGVGFVDAAGDFLVAGHDNRTSDSLIEFVVAKLSGSSGVPGWVSQPFGAASDFQGASAICPDGAGNPVAAGTAVGSVSGRDFAVVKLASATGATLWQMTRTGPGQAEDLANACAIDGSGDVIAAGYLTGSTSRQDFTVVKLSGKDGHDFQRDPLTLLGSLIDDVAGLGLLPGISISLQVKLSAASHLLQNSITADDGAALRLVTAFIQEVEAMRGVQISPADADHLISSAREILEALRGSSSRLSRSFGSRNRRPGTADATRGTPSAQGPRQVRPGSDR